MYEYLDRRYAMALYETAEEKGKVEQYINDLKFIENSMKDNTDFYEVVKHPQVATKQKKDIFINIFKGKIDEELLSFLLILIEKDRILFLKEKIEQLEKIVLEKNNTIEGIVKTTIPLTRDQYNTLLNNLEAKYEKKVILKEVIDPSILGGIYIRVKDEVIDGTVKLRVDEIKKASLSSKER